MILKKHRNSKRAASIAIDDANIIFFVIDGREGVLIENLLPKI